jgi:hypothetical protein
VAEEVVVACLQHVFSVAVVAVEAYHPHVFSVEEVAVEAYYPNAVYSLMEAEVGVAYRLPYSFLPMVAAAVVEAHLSPHFLQE